MASASISIEPKVLDLVTAPTLLCPMTSILEKEFH